MTTNNKIKTTVRYMRPGDVLSGSRQTVLTYPVPTLSGRMAYTVRYADGTVVGRMAHGNTTVTVVRND